MARKFLMQQVGAQGKPFPSSGPILIQAGWLAYAAGDLQAAEQDITQGLDCCRQLSLKTIVPQGLRSLAAVLSARGEHRVALEMVGEAHRLALGIHDDLLVAICAATEAEIYLKLGKIPDAMLLLETLETLPWPLSNPYYAPAYFTLIKLQIAKNQIRQVQSHLSILSAWAENLGHVGLLIAIRILQAQVAIACRDNTTARSFLEQALESAAPQDYRRLFLDADRTVIGMLPHLRTVAPAFVDSVLALLPKDEHSAQLLNPLTERELEVLRLIADDLTNQQIAIRLVTAVSTVKKHINRIFSKLQARDRTQAVNSARELGLL
jgi:LuxR family maltose regulon positive regulatory protein